MPDSEWTWPTIAATLLWRLAPDSTTLTRGEIAAVPADRVLREIRLPGEIRFSWHAPRQPGADRVPERGGLSTLEARWKRLVEALLWKLAPDGIALTAEDRSRIPGELQLLADGQDDRVDFRFIRRRAAAG